ncbi:hypothetical protein OKW35_000859 [Paraburkholderia sp. MM5477-R1]
MRATTAIPPTNHAHSAARTPDPRLVRTSSGFPSTRPPGLPGGHPNGTSLAALRWNAKRGHRHAAPAAAPVALRCRFRAVQAVARSSARTGRAAHCTSHRAAGPGRTRHDPRPDTRSDRTRRTGHAADRRSAAAANANASGRRPSVATRGNVDTTVDCRRPVAHSMEPHPALQGVMPWVGAEHCCTCYKAGACFTGNLRFRPLDCRDAATSGRLPPEARS